MKDAAIVLVHGMGKHEKGWSKNIQEVLKNGLPDYNIKPSFYETLYSDIVESPAFMAAFAKPNTEFTATDTQVMFNYSKLEAATDMAAKQMAPEDAQQPGLIEEGKAFLNTLFRYVAGYLGNAELKAKIDKRIRVALAQATDQVGNGRVILVGHSLGSVISWSLASDKDSPVWISLSKLITLGSPLGILQFAGLIKVKNVHSLWANVVAPGDIATTREVTDPPFKSEEGLVSLRVRRVAKDPHSALVDNPDVIKDWLSLTA
ncbi:MAG: hypothetical protein PHO26_07710 [Dehalococcoidia bacterium]|nr:hypothetical protein [Dehalococcoidia bacterium]MDD5494741.1 hypothetical protein [Dehalococcoidia bacterium]